MLNIRNSTADDPSLQFKLKPRKTQTNVAWLNEARGDHEVCVVLVGGFELPHFRLRVAQSQARHDLTPSCWSHCFLWSGAKVFEIALDTPAGFGDVAANNGVQQGDLKRYASATEFPNLAIVHVPAVNAKDVNDRVDDFRHQRAALDAPELLLMWLGYLWGVGRAGNPLLDGAGLPSAAFIETIISAAGFELTPGLASRSSCPEAIWQSARWWHIYREDASISPLTGSFSVTHVLPHPAKKGKKGANK